MSARNVIKWNTSNQVHPPFVKQFECPLCKQTVAEDDFITSYRLVEGTESSVYRMKLLCRKCRDSGN
jgi:hypothetical protein